MGKFHRSSEGDNHIKNKKKSELCVQLITWCYGRKQACWTEAIELSGVNNLKGSDVLIWVEWNKKRQPCHWTFALYKFACTISIYFRSFWNCFEFVVVKSREIKAWSNKKSFLWRCCISVASWELWSSATSLCCGCVSIQFLWAQHDIFMLLVLRSKHSLNQICSIWENEILDFNAWNKLKHCQSRQCLTCFVWQKGLKSLIDFQKLLNANEWINWLIVYGTFG